jgi:phthalate 4,5-dioxygenase oxygenase subunit
MLTKDENELLCRIGPGTLMGNLMREYWIPALLSSELPRPGSDPVRVLLLGEKLVAFRDANGRIGLLPHACPHRGASLFFGRNDQVSDDGGVCGLRCVYHGWKWGVDGACIDMPSEPAESDFKQKVRAKAYPCQERGGIVWAYMGPRATPPPLPDLEANMLPEDGWSVIAIQRECNWFQAMEGDIDSSHFGFLHGGAVDAETQEPGTFSYYVLKDRAPRYSVVDLEAGAVCATYRPAGPGEQYLRVGHFLFPFWTLPGQSVLGLKITARAWVPMDDEHTLFFMTGPKSRRLAAGNTMLTGGGMLPNTGDWLGRFRLLANAENDYLIDRDTQRSENSLNSYTGIQGIHLQDQAISESEGLLYDRSTEHLGTSDVLIIKVRRQLLAAARALATSSIAPPGVDNPRAYAVRSGGMFLPDGADWFELTKELRQAFVQHPELSEAISGGIV